MYCSNPEFWPDVTSWLGYCSGKLYFFPLGMVEETISVINTMTLTTDDVLSLECKYNVI